MPTGVAACRREPWRAPRSWVEPRYNVTRWTDMPCGGQFAGLEQPDLQLKDVRPRFATVR